MKVTLNSLKKPIITLAKVAGVFLLLAIAAFFIFRNMLLEKVLEKAAAKFKTDYHADLTVGSAAFQGLTGVELHNLVLVPEGKDTLLSIGTLQSTIRLGYALLLDFRVKELVMKDGSINVVRNAEGNNIDVFLKRNAAQSERKTSSGKNNYAKIIYKLISTVLSQVPSAVLIENFALKLSDDDKYASFHMQQLSLLDEQLSSTIEVSTRTFTQHWHINGFASPHSRKADVVFYTSDTGKVRVPYVDERFNLVTGFDSVHLNLESVDLDDDELQIKGFASVSNFLVNHPKISKKDVVIEHAEFKYNYLIGSDFISIDSSSEVRFNQVSFHPYIRFQNNPDTVYQLSIRIGDTKAQDFINSLPDGLFTHFTGMEAEGNFNYSLDFIYNENNPQALVFESNLKKDNLKIIKYGEANLSKLNGDFVYVPIEHGRPQRPVTVGMSNIYYTPIDQISPYLKKCVLTTEDPSFFYHRGFIDEAFRQSIIKNIRKRKFARGASTISMQLVKNVFLTREKTLSRKLEEILLVYILENNHLCSKERMFEVYLNIIEWGPDVYGIGEAAQFYFQKRPMDLTLSESLFLATIIPRPKGFMWRFGKDGYQKDFVGRQYHFLSDLMIRRNVLYPEDTLGLNHRIPITGPAKNLIIKSDTLVNDSVILDENGMIRDNSSE